MEAPSVMEALGSPRPVDALWPDGAVRLSRRLRRERAAELRCGGGPADAEPVEGTRGCRAESQGARDGRLRGERQGGRRGTEGARELREGKQPAPAPAPAPPPQPGALSLRELLLQVAPHAKIDVPTQISPPNAIRAQPAKVRSRPKKAEELPPWYTEEFDAHGPEFYGLGPLDDGGFFDDAGALASGAMLEAEVEDEDDKFMEKWSGLFSEGSPLVDGSAKDPFKDFKQRQKGRVVWKTNKERRGHHERYQQRRAIREGHRKNGHSLEVGLVAWSPAADGQRQDLGTPLRFEAADLVPCGPGVPMDSDCDSSEVAEPPSPRTSEP